MYSSFHPLIIDSEMIGQIFHAASHSTNRKDSISSCVSALMIRRSPLNVLQFVITQIVDALNRPSRFAFANILNKTWEAMPLFTNSNTSTAVIFKTFVLRVIAALKHRAPNVVDFRFMSTFGKSMRGSISQLLKMVTTTRSGIPSYQGAVVRNRLISALAQTQYSSFTAATRSAAFGGITNYFKSSKCSTDDRNFRRHNVVYASLCLAVGFWHIPETCCDYMKRIEKVHA